MTHEMILKHYASISELKHDFMEVKQDFGPTEWDRRLSSYAPTAKVQFPHANEEILVRMGLVSYIHSKTIYISGSQPGGPNKYLRFSQINRILNKMLKTLKVETYHIKLILYFEFI